MAWSSGASNPPRISLARLTAEQLRQSYADLFGYFGDDPWTEQDRGVKAIYFDGTRWKDDKKRIADDRGKDIARESDRNVEPNEERAGHRETG